MLVDRFVDEERMLLGFNKYKIVPQNRLCLNVMYYSYMYATTYHTAYTQSTMGAIADESQLATNACWGMAHEMGHIHQTRPGVKWHGMTECTVNIMAAYVQTTILNQPCRLQNGEMDAIYRNKYGQAFNSIMVCKSPHAQFHNYVEYMRGNKQSMSSDVFCKLIPFWQLELYFGKVLGRTPHQQEDKGGFYPDVYEYVRQHPDLKTAGEQQTEFAYICSKVSGYDLTDFFEKWGFLTPVDVVIDDYGNGRVHVTPERVKEVKERIKALHLPKVEVPMEYITDGNVEVFKKKLPVEKGTVLLKNGNALNFIGWKNVVVFEVRDENDQLVYVGEGKPFSGGKAWFRLPIPFKSSFKVYAVQYDGKRILIDDIQR